MQINKRKGFSLIELLVVISIIAVLTAVLVANFMGARERARDAQKISDLESLKGALRLYYNDHQNYPINDTVINDVGFTGYISNVSGIGFTYEQTSGGDGFNLSTQLEAGAGDDDTNSQTKCGITEPVDKIFVVCAR
ncbi:MAG: type II secretion system protein [Candidatus Shapirobacteria bacterium]